VDHPHGSSQQDIRSFADDYISVASQLKKLGMLPEYRPSLINILHNYVKHFGGYLHLGEMIAATVADSRGTQPATSLLLELSRSYNEPLELLEYFADSKSSLKFQHEPVLYRIIALLKDRVRDAQGWQQDYAKSRLHNRQVEWLESLLENKQYDRLRGELQSLLQSDRDDNRDALLSIQVRLAAATTPGAQMIPMLLPGRAFAQSRKQWKKLAIRNLQRGCWNLSTKAPSINMN